MRWVLGAVFSATVAAGGGGGGGFALALAPALAMGRRTRRTRRTMGRRTRRAYQACVERERLLLEQLDEPVDKLCKDEVYLCLAHVHGLHLVLPAR